MVLRGKVGARTQVHDFHFRRFLKCSHCGYALIGERQKGHVYYRCHHTKECPTTSVREEAVDRAISYVFEPLRFEDGERAILLAESWRSQGKSRRSMGGRIELHSPQLSQFRERLDRLTDAYVDRLIDRETLEARKATTLMEQKALEEKIAQSKSMIT